MQVAQLQLDQQRVDAATPPASTREPDEVAGPTAVSLTDGRAATFPRSAATEGPVTASIVAATPVAPPRRRAAARRQVTAPNVVGMPAVEAIAAVRASGLTPVIEQHETTSPHELGVVLLQEPPADGELVRGSSLELWIGAEEQQAAPEFPTASPVIAEVAADETPISFDRDRAYVDDVDDGWFAVEAHGPALDDKRASDDVEAPSEVTRAHADGATALDPAPSADPTSLAEVPVPDDSSREQRELRHLRLPRRTLLVLAPVGLLLVLVAAGANHSGTPANDAASGAQAAPVVHAGQGRGRRPRRVERHARTRVVVRVADDRQPRDRPRAATASTPTSSRAPSAPAPTPAALPATPAPSAAEPAPTSAPAAPAHPVRREFFTP